MLLAKPLTTAMIATLAGYRRALTGAVHTTLDNEVIPSEGARNLHRCLLDRSMRSVLTVV